MKKIGLGLICLLFLCGCSGNDGSLETDSLVVSDGEGLSSDISFSDESYYRDMEIDSANKLMGLLDESDFSKAYMFSYGEELSEDDMATDFAKIYNLNKSLKEKIDLADYRMNYYCYDDSKLEDKLASKILEVTSRYADNIIKNYKVQFVDGELEAQVTMMNEGIIGDWFEKIKSDIEKFGEENAADSDIYDTWEETALRKVWKDDYLNELDSMLDSSYGDYRIVFDTDWNDEMSEVVSCKIDSISKNYDGGID